MNFPKLGILGAGQLGKMLCERASEWKLETVLLDQSDKFPAAQMATEFILGDFTNAKDVSKLIGQCDVATIEIEKVSSEGLQALVESGVIVHPSPQVLNIIKDKGIQKQFYVENGFESSKFTLIDDKIQLIDALKSDEWNYPVVLKSRTGGYDGPRCSDTSFFR